MHSIWKGGVGTTGWLQTHRIVPCCRLVTVVTAGLLRNCSKIVLQFKGRKVVIIMWELKYDASFKGKFTGMDIQA